MINLVLYIFGEKVYYITVHLLKYSQQKQIFDSWLMIIFDIKMVETIVSLYLNCPVWSESSLCAQLVAKDLSYLHADREESDQTGRMPRLIWVFAGRTGHLVLSWGGLFYEYEMMAVECVMDSWLLPNLQWIFLWPFLNITYILRFSSFFK